VKDALPLPVAFDLGGNPEVCFKHVLLLSVRVQLYHVLAITVNAWAKAANR